MDHPTTSTLLTWMTFLPLLGAVLILPVLGLRAAGAITKAVSDQICRLLALVASGAVLVLGWYLWRAFDPQNPALQFVQHGRWITAYNIEYFVGVDGISITLIMLTALISFIATIASMPWWPGNAHLDEHHFSQRGVAGFMCMLLLLQTGMTGVFVSLDMFLFYVFWEVMLLPMYFLIGIWGGPRREYAAIKFFLYTLAGSVLMLVVMLAMYFLGPDTDPTKPGHQGTFSLPVLAEHGRAMFTGFWWKMAFLGLYIGFAIKVPVFPFHTWLPDAHVEAPTPISVILAGVLLKMGTYGLMRISYPILPEAALWFAPFMMAFGAWNIIYGSLCAMAQIRGVPRVNYQTGERFVESDLKKMIAYSSVAHMGFCLLGLAACNPAGLSACLFQMWNHGIITSMLFLLVGVIYDRAHHRDINKFGGLWTQMPQYGALT